MSTLIIIGAGGHGRVVADCAQETGQYQKIVFLDDCYPERQENHSWEIIGKVDTFVDYLDSAHFIVAFGSNKLRQTLLTTLNEANAKIISLIHPSAYVSQHTVIGNGVVIFAKAVINIGSKISDGCIINTAATIDHDCTLQSAVHVSPGVNIAGGVIIGELSWVGIGASIIECITLAANTQIASGSAVTQSTQKNSLYAGAPAVFKKSLPLT